MTNHRGGIKPRGVGDASRRYCNATSIVQPFGRPELFFHVMQEVTVTAFAGREVAYRVAFGAKKARQEVC